ncbi:MAG: cupin domain-containing protein [Candidatus Eisenbacteria bacterium]|nr:cupin domain-containing protein [Candidatus Eisenbacteria bacterium]
MHANQNDPAAAAAGETRPWGHFVVLADEPDHKVKRLVVRAGRRLSLQRHRHRSEHWLVVRGEAVVTVGEEELRIGTGQAVDIPRQAWHRVRNPGKADLVLIEVQQGESFAEEDIERAEDDFGRV